MNTYAAAVPEDVILRPPAVAAQRIRTGRQLLLCGMVTGPLSFVIDLAQALTRPGYDLFRQPVSSLALGPHGWIQVLNFLLGGVLMLGFALGLDRALRALGRPSRWAPALIASWAAALLGAGIFVTDPISGYPPGEPVHRGHTVHGVLHAFPFSILLVAALIAACAVFARRFTEEARPGWAAYCAATGVAVLAGFCLFALSFTVGAGPVALAGLIQLATIAVGWGWLALLALHLRSRLPDLQVQDAGGLERS
jgi:uncharacterized membrane protein YhaH (DUF805 family)